MKKIMFSDRYCLTKAVLEGRKTMTRRIIPADIAEKLIIQGDEFFPTIPCVGLKSRFKIGEIVAVAQPYRDCVNDILVNWGHKTDIAVMAFKELPGWTNKMFVRADLMPHKIRITDIHIKRLQDISDEDCLREGVEYSPLYGYYSKGIVGDFFTTPREAFAALIDKVSGKGTWEMNPYVFVYNFELVK